METNGLLFFLWKPSQIFCLDGDGAALMHMGTFATVGQRAPPNLKHVIFNNGAHDSVGGQPTEAANHEEFDFGLVAKACGYKDVRRDKGKEFVLCLSHLQQQI